MSLKCFGAAAASVREGFGEFLVPFAHVERATGPANSVLFGLVKYVVSYIIGIFYSLFTG